MIAILLATYNGEKYLAAQLDSILSQTEQGFHLYIRDDSSTDSTMAIAQTYAEKRPAQISFSQNTQNSGSAKSNFLGMMADVQADYVMLCDQDDVWLPDKLARLLEEMRLAETQYGAQTPLLAHSDMRVVDNGLQPVSTSFWAYAQIDAQQTTLHRIAVQNAVTGCATLYNRALAALLQTPPAYCIMHDWWLALTAAAFGHILPLPEATVLYRQHGSNAVGAKDVRSLHHRFSRLLNGEKTSQDLRNTYRQAEVFLRHFNTPLPEASRTFLQAYAAIPARWKGRRILETARLKVWKTGLARKLGQVLFM